MQRAGPYARVAHAYYQRWGQDLEFQALLRARPVVGDAELGERYLTALMPMVWRAPRAEDLVVEVRPCGGGGAVGAPPMSCVSKTRQRRMRDVEFAARSLTPVATSRYGWRPRWTHYGVGRRRYTGVRTRRT